MYRRQSTSLLFFKKISLKNMNRRIFIVNSLFAGGAMIASNSCQRTVSVPQSETMQSGISEGENMIMEPARKIPVLAETDVLVIGGGPAGVATAISAARGGADTWLVERYNHLGGLWTGGLVLPLFSTHGYSKDNKTVQVLHGLGGEMYDRLKQMNMTYKEINPVIDPEAGKYVLEEMIRESGVKMLYHALGVQVLMDGKVIKGVFIESKSGRQVILAKVVVDCTGDGDIFHWAGENYDEMEHAIGLVHRLGNVDRVKGNNSEANRLLGQPTPLKSVNRVNMWGDDDQNGIDVLNLTRLQMKYRKQIWENVEKLKQIPGYEEVFLLDTASQIGVRATRILDGEYRLTLEDSMTYKSFDDAVGVSGAWIPVLYQGQRVPTNERPHWQIPYRSLLPKSTENLLVAGRCFCFERELVEDARMIATCLVTGQGAGTAAAMAVKQGETVRNIDRSQLRKLLTDQNVWFG